MNNLKSKKYKNFRKTRKSRKSRKGGWRITPIKQKMNLGTKTRKKRTKTKIRNKK